MRRMIMADALAALCIASPQGNGTTEDELKTRFFTRQSIPLSEAQSLRHLEAGKTGQGANAFMDVETSFKDHVFTYRIIRESGSGTIRNKAFRGLLEGEEAESRKGLFSKSLFSEENYAFLQAEETAGAWRIRIDPKRKSDFLISGFLSLGYQGNLFSSEGKLVKNPSFWVKEASVAIEYSDFDGIDLPVSFTSNAQLRLLGQYFLNMSYIYLSVNGKHVDQDK